MFLKRIIPRLNYQYPIKNILYAIKGIFIRNFDDNNIKSFFGVNNIFYVNHARTGLRIALTSLNLPEKSGIGVSVFNCPTVFQAIKTAGHIPVFIDITNDFIIDYDDLRRKKSNIHALIITNLFGIPNKINEIKDIVKNIPLIEDCAHSFFSSDVGVYTGTLCDFGVFSIGKGKFPSIGDGGIIIINNQKYLSEIKYLIKKLDENSCFSEIINILKSLFLNFMHLPIIYGSFTFPILKRKLRLKNSISRFKHSETKMLKSNLNLFLSKFHQYKEEVNQQQSNALLNYKILCKYFDSSFNKEIILNNNFNYFMLAILLKDRDNVISALEKKGIELGRHFSSSILQAQKYGYKKGNCITAEYVAGNILTIPTYYKIKMKNESAN